MADWQKLMDKSVVDRVEKFAELYNAENYEELKKLYHPLAKVCPVGGAMVIGPDGAEATFKGAREQGMAKVERTFTEPDFQCKDFCLTYTTWNWYKADGELGGTIKDITGWKLVDGQWLIYTDIFNSP